MANLQEAILFVRESTVAVVRIRPKAATASSQSDAHPEFEVSFGSGFSIVRDRYVLTAHHVIDEDRSPGSGSRLYAFVVPANAERAHHFPVKGLPLLRPDLDLAVLELGPCATEGVHVPALPISFEPYEDGTRVVTVGFPAPEVHELKVDRHGGYRGGRFFLKSHANEGIVSAHYPLGDLSVYELNVGWHHGESGGPIVAVQGTPAAFSLMQQYRNVQTPHGIVAGPHRGIALASIREELAALGVSNA